MKGKKNERMSGVQGNEHNNREGNGCRWRWREEHLSELNECGKKKKTACEVKEQKIP